MGLARRCVARGGVWGVGEDWELDWALGDSRERMKCDSLALKCLP